MRWTPLRLLALALGAAACAGSAYDAARREDSIEGYRRYLRERGDEAAAKLARDRLAELEFVAARQQNSRMGYKRFIEEFPDSERRSDALILLENLRFEAAQAAGTTLAWSEFLRDHPSGAHLAQARAALDAADYSDAKREGSAKAMREYLVRHPETANRLEAERLLDDRLFAEARASGPHALLLYLEASPAGTHRDEARTALVEREVTARANLGDFEGARRRTRIVGDAGARAQLEASLDALELDWAAASLDPGALGLLARGRSSAAPRARGLEGELRRDPALQALRRLAQRLEPTHFARPEPELVRVLSAGDPRERWLAAEELGRMGAWRALEPLLNAAVDSRFARVRAQSFSAMQTLFALLPRDVQDVEWRARVEALRKVAQSPALQVRLAVLEDLLGDPRALADYAKALRGDAADLLVLRRIASLRAERGEVFASAAAARDWATRVMQAIEQRSGGEGAGPLLTSRILCGLRDEAQAARSLLRGIPPAQTASFSEDLKLFLQRAEDAERLASARLSDAEAAARAEDLGFRVCEDDGGLAARMRDGESERLAAVEDLGRRVGQPARLALEKAKRLDPSPAVRAAATARLEAMPAR
jgi:hypothetical protein